MRRHQRKEGGVVPVNRSELLSAVYEAHGPALLHFVRRLTSDPVMAEDVVQEALLRAWKSPSILEQSDDSVRAWLFRVARNLVIDDWRSARHNREIGTEQLDEHQVPDGVDAALDAWLVEDALSAISREHRVVIVSAYYLGRSIADIAAEQGIPEGTVKSRLHYALRGLRLALQERGVTR